MTGKTLVTLKNNETACLGSAILAGTAAKVFESVEKICEKAIKTDKVYAPGNTDYTECLSQYRKLDDILF